MGAQSNKKAQPYYFISYCREEVTFVDSLADELEKNGINTWVDIRDLVPGITWQKQLDDGVENAEAILLVVSKESMKSKAVTDEWAKAINRWGKRVILIIFERAQIPQEILKQNPEWVDFTGNFNKALDRLVACINQTGSTVQEPKKIPPQKGKRIPVAAIAFIVLITASFFLVWKLFSLMMGINDAVIGIGDYSTPMVELPLVGFPLIAAILFGISMIVLVINQWYFMQIPWRVFNRKHNAEKIRNVLYATMFINASGLFLHVFYPIKNTNTPIYATISMLLSFLLLYLLTSKGMYRWAGATGAIIKASTPDISGHTENGEPRLVGIEYAPQDHSYAEAFKFSIVKAGHTTTEDLQKAEVILCLLSVHKTDSVFNPQEKELYPILLQSCKISEKLSRLQWIDLRRGRASIDAIANLLDEPHELIRTLGVLPVRTTILPSPVKVALTLFQIPLGISVSFYMVLLIDALTGETTVYSNIEKYLPMVIALGIYLLRKYINDRKLKFLSPLSYKWILGFAFVLACASTYTYHIDPGFNWSEVIIILPYWLMPAVILHKDIRLWLPTK